MEAIKKIIKTHNNKITIDIPEEFKNKNIEVIMIPSEENDKFSKKNFLQLLNSGPTLSDDEINNIKKVGGKINKWNIKEY